MASRSQTIWTVAVIIAFVAFLTWSTLSAQKAECEVCVEFAGGRNCASASHENEDEAARSAQTTACGPLTSGMNDAIACDNRPAVSRQCRTR